MSEDQIITKDTCFEAKKLIYSIQQYKEGLAKYSANFEREKSLKTDTPIFVDTNVLIRYYTISFTARKSLFEFLKSVSKKLVITSQVQYEFLKNREDQIQQFFEQVTNVIPKNFTTEVLNKTKSFVEQNKEKLKDYPFMEEGIIKSQVELDALLQQLNEEVGKRRQDHTDLVMKDELLDLLTSCNLVDKLKDEELKIVTDSFKTLSSSIISDKVSNFLENQNNAFPGAGDIKEKPDNPYGDYIIYHEIMKYMINNKKDAIFLTFDTTKGDWMTKKKKAHLHYIINMYANTKHILYILDADRILEDLLHVNIDSLIVSESKETFTPVTTKSLQKFVKNSPLFAGRRKTQMDEHTVNELLTYGYDTIEKLEKELKRANSALLKYEEDRAKHFADIGALRAAIRIANPAINTINTPAGIEPMTDYHRKTYKSYFDYLEP